MSGGGGHHLVRGFPRGQGTRFRTFWGPGEGGLLLLQLVNDLEVLAVIIEPANTHPEVAWYMLLF